ncbi:MAG: amidohydrolase [Spirochaetaceae bacterium]|nr:MAG: amidohydrolase [Spirochaetaceae bacterium]
MLATVEMLRSGTTCCCDMYLHMQSAAEAFEASGMRAVVAQGLFSFLPDPAAALQDSVEFCRRWNGAADGRISTLLAPHAPYTCHAEYLKEIAAAGRSEGIGLHTHLSESKAEVEQSYAEHGVSPVRFLADLGIIGEHSLLAAHCVHLNSEDIRILAEANVAVAHNPQCNMKLGNGIAPVSELLLAKVPVGVATDGVASNNNLNLWEEIRLAALLQKGRQGDTTALPAPQALSLAGEGAARALSLDTVIGRIKTGHRADLIFIDLEHAQFQPLHDPQAALVYSAYGSEVSGVMVDGVELLRDGRLTLFDEAEIYAKAGARANRLFAAAGVQS